MQNGGDNIFALGNGLGFVAARRGGQQTQMTIVTAIILGLRQDQGNARTIAIFEGGGKEVDPTGFRFQTEDLKKEKKRE